MIRLSDVLAGTGGRLIGDLPETTAFQRVIHDSRMIEPGDLFVALHGERLDGHEFIAKARNRGAIAALVDDAWVSGQSSPLLPVIVVPNTLEGLRRLSIYWRGLFTPEVIGITGSIGKSSTKEIIASIAAQRYRVVKSAGSYNNEIGLPLTVMNIAPDTEVVVLEMGGAYRAGEIAELAAIAHQSIGVVTNVTHSHLARMGSLDAIAETKTELVSTLPESGVAILNIDDPRVKAMAEHASCRVVFYGLDDAADVRATNVEGRGTEGISFTLHAHGESNALQLPLLGRHSIHMALAGIATGFELGLKLGDIVRGFSGPDVQLRLLLTPAVNGSTILDDHYNANPKSSLAALALLEDLEANRKIAVLGDMLELGDFEEEGHRIVGRRVIDVVDILYTLGPRAALIGQEALALRPGLIVRHFDDKAEMTKSLGAELQSGDLALVKGSRGLQMETVIEALRTDQQQGSH